MTQDQSRMSEKYWDRVALTYEQEIFDTLKNDRNQVVLNCIDHFTSKNLIASDFGCGVGRYLPLLSARFKRVYAIDISNKCLEIAREACASLDNIVYVKSDLTDPQVKVKAHFGISINMLIMPSPRKRKAILRNIFQLMARSGYLLLVVPSLESALYSNFRCLEWNLNSSSRHSGVSAKSLKTKDSFSISKGLLNWGGTPTKHYLKEELVVLLEKTGFTVSGISKVEYPWAIEFTQPPRWMKQPYPWDWLSLCRKG